MSSFRGWGATRSSPVLDDYNGVQALKLEKLQRENRKLQDELGGLEHYTRDLRNRMDALYHENRDLRSERKTLNNGITRERADNSKLHTMVKGYRETPVRGGAKPKLWDGKSEKK